MASDVFLQSFVLIEHRRALRRTSQARCEESQKRRRQHPQWDGAGQGCGRNAAIPLTWTVRRASVAARDLSWKGGEHV
jgi:hypothetical protein